MLYNHSMEKIKTIFRKIRKVFKTLKKRGILAKIIVIISSLALLATGVLPFLS